MEYMRAMLRVASIAVTFLIGVTVGIIGLVLLDNSTGYHSEVESGERELVTGLVILGLGSLFTITALIMAFICGKPRRPAE
jgi:hypothetical protein